MLTSSSSGVLELFFHGISFHASVKPIATFLTAQTTGPWKTACDSLAPSMLAQTSETAQIYGSRILITPPTNAYTQYKFVQYGVQYITSAREGSSACVYVLHAVAIY